MSDRTETTMFQRMFDALVIGVIAHDREGRVVYANQAFADLLGYSLDRARLLSAHDVIHPGDREHRDAQAVDLFSGVTAGAVVHRRLLRADGSVIRARVRKSVVEHPDGRPLIVVQIEAWSDVGDLEHKVRHDHLTGLLSRHGFEIALAATYPRRPTFLAMIDVDHMKSVNDSYGHVTGDALLAAIAAAFATAPLPGALFCRWAGDEFLACAPRSTAIADPGEFARLLHAAASTPADLPGVPHPVTPSVSIGTTVYDPAAGSMSDALARADLQMYRGKRL
ncbi:diguanylate cyclase [Tsukamurella sp. 8F]|uniref:GGDEF domain-containing protein n=1 Tax=unclassified Tsukamurella TaxID=2633480 RepID=UPI0023B8C788|nr:MULTISPECIES: GGDEF domain-containing protein [unclassified Tsukamurella]MDF0531402.1 diguanylate cyclase [Tsukamurella sp. 8J]MDF0585292.1 diguanylate cyclase [Tsukamurella sp. 8F]